MCFNSLKTVESLVDNWITDKLSKGWDIGTTVCYYNLGKIINECNYYENYKRL